MALINPYRNASSDSAQDAAGGLVNPYRAASTPAAPPPTPDITVRRPDVTVGEGVNDLALALRTGARNVTAGMLGAPVAIANAVQDSPVQRTLSKVGKALTGREQPSPAQFVRALSKPNGATVGEILTGRASPETYGSRSIQQPKVVRGMQESIAVANQQDMQERGSARLHDDVRRMEAAEGFTGTVAEAVRNPRAVGFELAKQIPQLVMPRVPRSVGGTLAAQGTVAGAQMDDQVARELQDQVDAGTMTQDEAADRAALAGTVSAGLNVAMPAAFGPGARTIERVVAGRPAADAASRGVISGALRGAAGEALEEGATEALEQVNQNIATDRPWTEGIGEQAALGAILGGAIGGPVGGLEGVLRPRTLPDGTPLPDPNAGPMSRAANQAADNGALTELRALPAPDGTRSYGTIPVTPEGTAILPPEGRFGGAPGVVDKVVGSSRGLVDEASIRRPFPNAAPGTLADAGNAIAEGVQRPGIRGQQNAGMYERILQERSRAPANAAAADADRAPTPINLDPETGEELGIDVESWPSALPHQQPRAILDAMKASAAKRKDNKPPGVTAITQTFNVSIDTARALRNRAISEMQAEAGSSRNAEVGVEPALDTPATAAEASEPASNVSYNDSGELLDTDTGAPSGGPFTIRDAAQRVADRTEGGRVFPVDGGFVVRTPRSDAEAVPAQEREQDPGQPSPAARTALEIPDTAPAASDLTPAQPSGTSSPDTVAAQVAAAPTGTRPQDQKSGEASAGGTGSMPSAQATPAARKQQDSDLGTVFRDAYLKAYGEDRALPDARYSEAAAEIARMVERKDAEGLRNRNFGDPKASAAGRAVFEAITGVKLPKGRAATEQVIDEWAGVSTEERGRRTEAKRQEIATERADRELADARRRAEAIRVGQPDAETESGAAYVDRLLSEGYSRIAQRGAQTYLYNAEGTGYRLPNKYLAQYARMAAPRAEEAARAAQIERAANEAGMDALNAELTALEDGVAGADAAAGAPVATINSAGIDRKSVDESAPPPLTSTKDGLSDADFAGNLPAYIEQYRALAGQEAENPDYFNADLAKELFPEYSASNEARRDNNEKVAGRASKIAFAAFEDRLQQTPEDGQRIAYLMAGGTGAGKSSLKPDSGIVYDSTMYDPVAAKRNVEKVLASGRGVEYRYVYAEPESAFRAAIQRGKDIGRYVNLTAFVRTHEGAYRAVQQLMEDYANDGRVEFYLFDNTGFAQREIESLPAYDYNGLRERLQAILDAEQQTGRISEGEYRAIAGTEPATRTDKGGRRQGPRANPNRGPEQGQGLVEPETPPAGGVSASEPTTALGDFGEKLEGARKFLPPSLKDELGDEQIATQPLSKVWPADAHASIEDPTAAALAFAARAEVPAKPRKAFKVKRWVEQVKLLRSMVLFSEHELRELEAASQRLGLRLDGFFAKVRLLARLPRETWKRVEKVGEYPDARRSRTAEELKAQGLETRMVDPGNPYLGFGLFRIGTDERLVGDARDEAMFVQSPFSSVTIDGKTHRFEVGNIGPDELQQVRALLGEASAPKGGLTASDFEIRSYRNKAETFINRKGDSERRALKTFTGTDALKDARAFLKADGSIAELESAWEAVKARDNVAKADTRRDENRERVGENRRNGKDVTEQMFTEAFGFRGVQFGNWVKQGKGAKDRQGLLNEAYDALLDLADVLGIPSRAISLEGSLGLALGARGTGRASAHFEPDSLVINLTKTKGAGSLAHEWFHALDNYFSRKRGGKSTASREGNYITYRPEPAWQPINARTGWPQTSASLRTRLKGLGKWDDAKSLEENAAAAGWQRDASHPEGVRPQVERAFTTVVDALNESPMAGRALSLDKGKGDGYWHRIIERGARSFENYVISKLAQRGWSNDFLANVRDWNEWQKIGKNHDRYPYLFPEEEAPVIAAFDGLFETIQSEDTADGNVRLFSKAETSVSEFLGGAAIASTDGKSVPRFEKLRGLVDWAVKNWADRGKSIVTNTDIGDVALDRRAAKDSISHGMSADKAQALAIVPEIVEQGRLIGRHQDKVDRPITWYTLAAPVRIGDEDMYAIAVVKSTQDRQGMYLHEVVLKEKAHRAFKTGAARSGTHGTATDGRAVRLLADALEGKVDAGLGGQPLFSATRGAQGSAPLTFDRALQLKAAITGQWGANAPTVMLVEDAEGFPAFAKADPDYRRAEGLYGGKRTIWINVGGIATEQRFAEVLAHEALGHYGVEAVVGKDWPGIVSAIANHRRNGTGAPSVRRAIQSVQRRYGDLDAETFAKETIAVMAEQGARNGLIGRVVAAVRAWLRKHMPDMKWTEADIRGLLGQADSFLRAGRSQTESRAMVQAHAFSRLGLDRVRAPATKAGPDPTEMTVAEPRSAVNADPRAEWAFSRGARSAFDDAANFARSVRRFVAGNLAGDRPIQVTQGTPDVYVKLGQSDRPFVIVRRKLDEIQKSHPEITEPVLTQLVRHLHEPVAVFRSGTSSTNPNGLVALTELEIEGKPVMIALHMGGARRGEVVVNKIASYYGKDSRRAFLKSVGDLLYLDKSKTPDWLTTGLQLPKVDSATSRGSASTRLPEQALLPKGSRAVVGNLLTDADVVKPFSDGTGHYSKAPVQVQTDARGVRRIQMGGETFREVGTRFYLTDGAGRLRDFRDLDAARAEADRIGAEVRLDDPAEGEPQTFSVVLPEAGERAAGVARPLFSKAPEEATEDHGPDPDRGFAPTVDFDALRREKKPLSAYVQGGLNWLKERAWLPMVPLNYLVDYVQKGQRQVHEFMRIRGLMDSYRGEQHAKYSEIQQDWLKLVQTDRKNAEALADVMHDSTRWQVDPSVEESEPLKFHYGDKWWPATFENVRMAVKEIHKQIRGRAGDDKSQFYEERDKIRKMGIAEALRPGRHAILRKRFLAMSPEAQAMYVRARDAYKQSIQEWDAVVLENVEQEMALAEARADRDFERQRQELRDTLSGDELTVALDRASKRHAKATSDAALANKSKLAQLRRDMESARLQGPYFPLARFGDYFAAIRDKDGKLLRFDMFENSGERDHYVKQVMAADPTLKIRTGMSANKDEVRGAVDAGFMLKLEQTLTENGATAALKDAVWQQYLTTLPGLSQRKHFIHRKGTPGYSADAMRAYGDHMFHMAHQIAKLRYGPQLRQAVDLAREEAANPLQGAAAEWAETPLDKRELLLQEHGYVDLEGDLSDLGSQFANGSFASLPEPVKTRFLDGLSQEQRERARKADALYDSTQADMLVNELEHRLEWVLNPQGGSTAQKITSFAFLWNLAISPAAALVNWTQTPMLGIPILGANLGGMTKAANAIRKASMELARSKKLHLANHLTGNEKKAFDEFLTRGLLDRTYAQLMAGVGDTGVKYSALREKWMSRVSFLFHNMERINRETTALAAYRLAVDKGMSHREAVDEAVRLTHLVHFDMTNSARARALQSDAAKVLMVHRSHQLNMTYRMLRDLKQMLRGATPEERSIARQQFVGIMGMHALLAGVAGVPFYGIAMMAAGAFKNAFGDDDDERTPEDMLKKWLYDAMPKEWADIVLYGAPSKATGASLYNRIGFPDFFFRDPSGEMEGRTEAEYYINQFLGPAFAIPTQVWTGINYIGKGQLGRGVENLLPKGVRDVIKAGRYGNEGVLTLRGDPVVDEVNAWEMIGQAAGFSPFKVSEAYEQRNAKKGLETRILQRRTGAMNRYMLGMKQGDPDMMKEAMQDIIAFNRAYPEKAITMRGLRQSVRTRLRYSDRAGVAGMVLDQKLEGRIQRDLGY